MVYYDDRILSLDTDEIEVTPRMNGVSWSTPSRGIASRCRTLPSGRGRGGIRLAEERLEGFINPQIRAVLGSENVTSATILSPERSALMDLITEQAQLRANALGWKCSMCG